MIKCLFFRLYNIYLRSLLSNRWDIVLHKDNWLRKGIYFLKWSRLSCQPRRHLGCRSLALHCTSSLKHSEMQMVSSVSSQSSKQSANMSMHSVAQATDKSLSLIQSLFRLLVKVCKNWVTAQKYTIEEFKKWKGTYGHDRAHHPLDTIVSRVDLLISTFGFFLILICSLIILFDWS